MRTLTSWKVAAPALLIALSLAPALQAQAPTLSREYIRLGGRILAIEQAASPGYVAPIYEGWDAIDPVGAAGWHVVGAGDFDRNGVPDLVWQNNTTGQVVVRYYGGAGGAVYQGYAVLASGVAGWTVVAVADMNGDGVPDLIWQNTATTQIVVYYYGGPGGAVYQGSAYWDTGASGWTVVGAADFDGNGTPDLVWLNNPTTQVVVHYFGYSNGAPVYQGYAGLDTGAAGWVDLPNLSAPRSYRLIPIPFTSRGWHTLPLVLVKASGTIVRRCVPTIGDVHRVRAPPCARMVRNLPGIQSS